MEGIDLLYTGQGRMDGFNIDLKRGRLFSGVLSISSILTYHYTELSINISQTATQGHQNTKYISNFG